MNSRRSTAAPMTSEKTFGEILNTWVQTIGIVCAGAWAAYTFVYKDITLPKSAPVNISVTLNLKKIGPKSPEKQGLTAVEMQTAATNPSAREVRLLSSAWIARGCSVIAEQNDPSFIEQAQLQLNSLHEGYAEQFAKFDQCSNAAAGHLFGDSFLKPNESVRRTKVFYVPTDRYDEIDVDVRVLTAERPEGVDLQWKVENGGLRAVFFRVDGNGRRTEFQKDKNGNYLDKDFAEFGIQESHSSWSLSLWQ
jgi:hypothetical protein